VPAWIRKVLLRGLRVDPDERFPSMAALLAALGQDPAVRRRRFVATATGALLIVTAAVGAQRLSAGQRAVCAGAPGRIAAVWGPTQREAVRRAFTAAGKTRATQVFTGVASLLDQYVARWSAIYGEACQATHVRGEQSAEVLDLRMGCLGERLGSARALVDVFSQADERVLENAVSAASSLPQLDRCSDVAMLRAVVKPPDDPAVRARVAALRDDVAKVEALGKSGHCERAVEAGRAAADAAAKLGYLPVKAEAFYQLGRLGEYCTDSPSAVAALEESTLAAEGSHHDEIAVVASVYLAFQHALRVHDARLARYWVRHGEAILARFPGHPLLEAWIAGAQANVLQAEGDWEGSLEAERRALAL
jgi:hypothetical protein